MTILIIGEQPGPNPGPPLQGAVGDRIAEYAGLDRDAYLAATERHNLLDGGEWTTDRARVAAGMVWPQLIGRRTILLGQRVAAAFSVQWPVLRWARIDDRGTEVAILPHPSGLNRWWNEAENRAAARRFLRAAFGTDEP